jgi:futalosine hydrolase
MAATAMELNHQAGLIRSGQGLRISFLITGIGMVSTAYHLTRKIIEDRPNLAIQAGIGGVNDKGRISETYIIREDYFSDLGVLEKGQFKSLFEMGLAGADEFPFRQGKLPNPYLAEFPQIGLQKASGKTVNQISSGPVLEEENEILIESMEGAAFHYTCLLEKIPFLQIRAVSNLIGERDKSKWKMQESLTSLHEALQSVIENI